MDSETFLDIICSCISSCYTTVYSNTYLGWCSGATCSSRHRLLGIIFSLQVSLLGTLSGLVSSATCNFPPSRLEGEVSLHTWHGKPTHFSKLPWFHFYISLNLRIFIWLEKNLGGIKGSGWSVTLSEDLGEVTRVKTHKHVHICRSFRVSYWPNLHITPSSRKIHSCFFLHYTFLLNVLINMWNYSFFCVNSSWLV